MKSKKIISCFALFILNISFGLFDSSAQALTANAGSNTSVCLNDSVQIGGNPAATGGTTPYTYSWQPAGSLDDPAAANPNAFPTSNTPYTLTVTDALGNISVSVVNVTVLPLPTVISGPDQTITGGTNTLLQANGAVNYLWFPAGGLQNENTATPFAEPGSTTTYCVAGMAANGCTNFDCTVIEVIPSDTVIIYNAFTPNGDGTNDVFYIGNLQQFPDNKLEVFNRNGKLVYQASNYTNNWNGKIEGTELPCATYYVVIDLGSGKGKVHGAVTIIR